MGLSEDYLEYPRRRLGYDHDLYPWSALHERAPVHWPGGARVAVWVCISAEVFPLEPGDAPFRAPGHMATPYPDYRHYTARDYADTLVRQYRRLADEGGTVMCIPLHAYLIGQPHRIGPFEEALREIAADGRGWLTTAGAIADAWRGKM